MDHSNYNHELLLLKVPAKTRIQSDLRSFLKGSESTSKLVAPFSVSMLSDLTGTEAACCIIF